VPIRLLLVDDHALFRAGLRSLLLEPPDVELVGEADTGREGVRLARDLRPDVVLMDISMPDLNGIEATRQIAREVPRARVVILSAHGQEPFVSQALESGAAGYLVKDAAFDEVLTAVRTVAGGRSYVSPAVAGTVIEAARRGPGPGGHAVERLTPRQREVLQLVAEGWTTKQIAAHLHVSPKTVETHRQKVMDTLGLHSVADLTKFALREGLTSLEG